MSLRDGGNNLEEHDTISGGHRSRWIAASQIGAAGASSARVGVWLSVDEREGGEASTSVREGETAAEVGHRRCTEPKFFVCIVKFRRAETCRPQHLGGQCSKEHNARLKRSGIGELM